MRTAFPEYYQLTQAELTSLEAEAIFAFDASFLLDMYRYSEATRNNMLRVLRGLGDQAWLPHRAAEEFHKNRLIVIASLRARHSELLKTLKSDSEKLSENIGKACQKHPLLDAEVLMKPLLSAFEQVERQILSLSDKHPKATLSLEEDPIWCGIEDVFAGRVGEPFTAEELRELEEEGKKRFERLVPPGFKDEKSKEYPYGDLIIWRQMIRHSAKQRSPFSS